MSFIIKRYTNLRLYVEIFYVCDGDNGGLDNADEGNCSHGKLRDNGQ